MAVTRAGARSSLPWLSLSSDTMALSSVAASGSTTMASTPRSRIPAARRALSRLSASTARPVPWARMFSTGMISQPLVRQTDAPLFMSATAASSSAFSLSVCQAKSSGVRTVTRPREAMASTSLWSAMMPSTPDSRAMVRSFMSNGMALYQISFICSFPYASIIMKMSWGWLACHEFFGGMVQIPVIMDKAVERLNESCRIFVLENISAY